MESLRKPEKNVVHDILGVRGGAGEPKRHRHQSIAMPRVQLAQRLRGTFSDKVDELGVAAAGAGHQAHGREVVTSL